MHLRNPTFSSLSFQKEITYEAHLFFPKYSKFYVDAGNAAKNSENIFWFSDNCILIGCVKHSLLLREREFFSSDVNMLKNRLNISDTTKKEFFDLIFFQRDQKVWLKHCRAYLSSLSAP